MKKLSLLTIVLLVALGASAQEGMSKKERKEERRKKSEEAMRLAEEGTLVFQRQNAFGIQLRTNGYGAFYEHARMRSPRKSNIYRIDIQESKHVKEQKLMNPGIFGNAFIYGKINYFYPVTLGFGQQYVLGQKGNKNGVAVSAIYNAGLALGLLRPYYLIINDNGQERTSKYEDDSDKFLNGAIEQSAGLGKGWGEIKLKPGGFAKIGLRFDYGRYNQTVSAIEIGMSVEAYGSKVPIMANNKEEQIFFQGHIALMFGRRR